MKESRKCPKCGETDIIFIRAKNGESRGIRVGFTVFSLLRPATYVCSQCGYAEEYFSPKQIKKM